MKVQLETSADSVPDTISEIFRPVPSSTIGDFSLNMFGNYLDSPDSVRWDATSSSIPRYASRRARSRSSISPGDKTAQSFTKISAEHAPFHRNHFFEYEGLRKDSAIDLGADFPERGLDGLYRTKAEAANDDQAISNQYHMHQGPLVEELKSYE